MLKLLKQWWWKMLAIALVLYSTIVGFYLPLGAGIRVISPEKATAGSDVNLTITGYNTHFKSGDDIKVALRNDSNTICPTAVSVINNNVLTAQFHIPAGIKIKDKSELYSIVVSNIADGTFGQRSAFSILGGSESTDVQGLCDLKIDPAGSMHATFPNREILYETIRNLYFHVPMWFAMIMLLVFSFGGSIAYLATGKEVYDVFAEQAVYVAMLFGTLGILTGMLWAKNTWGAYWVNDPRLNGAAVGMLVYLAYIILRNSITNEISRARVSAVYGIFAFVIYIVFIFIIPRMNDTLHPGAGGNPAFSNYDLDSTMRMVFYPACMGFILIGFWIASILIRAEVINRELKAVDSSSNLTR